MEANNPVYKLQYFSPVFEYMSKTGRAYFPEPHKEAMLFFVYSGELTISCQNEKINLKKGEYAFVKRCITINLIKNDSSKETFNGIYMGLDKCFLWSIYNRFYTSSFCCYSNNFEQNIIKLPFNPYLQSLYISLGTYLQYGVKPTSDILQLKMLEAVHSLSLTDKRFLSCLFDFIIPFYISNMK